MRSQSNIGSGNCVVDREDECDYDDRERCIDCDKINCICDRRTEV